MNTLAILSSNGYLNLSDLPYNCIFNKVVTGCGGTTIVLFNNENYVIAVPTTELITNKTGLSEAGVATITNYDGKEQTVFGLFGVFSYSVKKELKKYAEGKGTKKIMCTYDKIGKLAEYLEPTDYRLLVDEYHILLKAYSYRSKAIDGVLSTFRSYKSFCFMSATPIQADFKPSCLADVEEIEAVWDETDTMIVKLDLTNKPYIKAANYINAYKKDGFIEINGNRSYEAFFFINSVTDIASILQYCDLSNEEVKIVCADNESNRAKLAGYTITNSRSENKPFTFITSKSFEGADYFSDSALCFVVSNSTNTNTLLDISTDIYQIAGRIRTESISQYLWVEFYPRWLCSHSYKILVTHGHYYFVSKDHDRIVEKAKAKDCQIVMYGIPVCPSNREIRAVFICQRRFCLPMNIPEQSRLQTGRLC